MLNKVREWLILFRAHTAILETPMAIAGAALGLGTIWSFDIILWAIFGVIYHYAGYGMNSYVDWKKGFDKDDPRKQHHPLNKGTIKPENAKKAIFGLLILLIIYGEWIAGFSIVAHISVVIMLTSGIAYNYLGKRTIHKYIPISIVHTMVFVFPYFVYSDEITLPFVFGACAYFIHHVYQIAISGDVKDIDQDESSLISWLGAEVKDSVVSEKEFRPKIYTLMLATVLSMTEIGLAAFIPRLIIDAVYPTAIVVLLGCWMFYENNNVISAGPYDREKRVSAMSRKELAGFWMILASFIPVITIKGFAIVLLGSLIYFLPMSKFMWGNWLKPEV